MWKGVWLGCGDRKMRLDVGRFGLSGSGEDATGPSEVNLQMKPELPDIYRGL